MDNQKKKKVIIGATTIAVIILMTGGIATGIAFNRNEAIKKANMQEVRKILDESEIQDKTCEYGTTINITDFHFPKGVKVMINGQEVRDTYTFNKLGKTEVKLEGIVLYKDFFNKNKEIKDIKLVSYNIVDTTKPEIIGAEDKTIKQGDQINLKDNIKVEDNVDKDLEVKINGNVDINTPGEYEITYTATDRSNNTTEKKIKIKVETKEQEKVEEKEQEKVEEKQTEVKEEIKNNQNSSSAKTSNQTKTFKANPNNQAKINSKGNNSNNKSNGTNSKGSSKYKGSTTIEIDERTRRDIPKSKSEQELDKRTGRTKSNYSVSGKFSSKQLDELGL